MSELRSHLSRERHGVNGADTALSEFMPESEGSKFVRDTALTNSLEDGELDFLSEPPPRQSESPKAWSAAPSVKRPPQTFQIAVHVSKPSVYIFLCGIAVGVLLTAMTGSVPDPLLQSDGVAAAPTLAADRFLAPDNQVITPVAGSTRITSAADLPTPSFRGVLVVRSTPAGAQVTLNGQPAGITPLTLTNLEVGSRAVRLALDGYLPWTSVVRIVTGQKATVTADLQPRPQQPDAQ